MDELAPVAATPHVSRLCRVVPLISLAICLALPASTEASPAPTPPWLGVRIEDAAGGARVIDVIEAAPAAAAGLRAGDVIVAIDGQPVDSSRALIRRVSRYQVGDRIDVEVQRRDQRNVLQVLLEGRLTEDEVRVRRLLGKPAPNFAVQMLRGDLSGELEGLRGNVVVLELWATWCNACVATHAPLSAFARAHRKDDLVVLAVSQESAPVVQAYLREHGDELGIAIGRDRDGSVFRSYLATGVPLLVVIDRRGLVRHAGAGGGDNLDAALWTATQSLRRGR